MAALHTGASSAESACWQVHHIRHNGGAALVHVTCQRSRRQVHDSQHTELCSRATMETHHAMGG